MIEAQNEMSTVIEDIMSKTAIGKKKACLKNIGTIAGKNELYFFFMKYKRKLFNIVFYREM